MGLLYESLQIFGGQHTEFFFKAGTEIFGIIEAYCISQIGNTYRTAFLFHNPASGFQTDIANES